MDSSRSGLLSTLLMTLPLIVVPAIALLRPPGPAGGVSTAPLDAAESSDDFLDDLNDLELAPKDRMKTRDQSAPGKSSEFDGLFEESPKAVDNNKPDASRIGQNKEKSRKESDGSFSPFDLEDSKSPPLNQPNPVPGDSRDDVQKIVDRLNLKGAVRTLWFQAGPKSPVGFAAFFRGETELMRIRFEAVGQTPEECARNVLDQVTQWQAEQAVRRQ
jgi:hypothetical protein